MEAVEASKRELKCSDGTIIEFWNEEPANYNPDVILNASAESLKRLEEIFKMEFEKKVVK